MMRLFIKVLVPTVLFSSALLFTKVLLDKPAHISTLLLYSNFVSPYMVGNDFYLWYVDCMLQILLLVWLCHHLSKGAPGCMNKFSFVVAVFVVALALKLSVQAYMFEGFFRTRPGDRKST